MLTVLLSISRHEGNPAQVKAPDVRRRKHPNAGTVARERFPKRKPPLHGGRYDRESHVRGLKSLFCCNTKWKCYRRFRLLTH